jgi:hypothetical protein
MATRWQQRLWQNKGKVKNRQRKVLRCSLKDTEKMKMAWLRKMNTGRLTPKNPSTVCTSNYTDIRVAECT